MEVHHPDSSHTGKKTFKEYFLEFLMLFLAVTLGFFAENMREENVEHHKEIEYVKSMIEDLRKDTANIQDVVIRFEKLSLVFDTVLKNFDKGTSKFSQSWSNNFVRIVKGGYPDYYYTDRTLQQLKNSGGMRLIRIQRASDAIVDYDDANKDFITEANYLGRIHEQVVDESFRLWSFKLLNQKLNSTEWRKKKVPEGDYWIIKDKTQFENLYNLIEQFSQSILFQKKNLLSLQKQAIDLITLLNKEYHLD